MIEIGPNLKEALIAGVIIGGIVLLAWLWMRG